MNAQLKPEQWPDDVGPNHVGAIHGALAKAQAEMHNPAFDSTNPHFKNKFASLASVRNAVIPVLAKHGIAVSQDLSSVEGGVSCTTRLFHSSGHTLSFGPLILPVSKNDAQGFGSAATYARRYSLMAVACVVGDDDDDANHATGKPAASEGLNPRGDLGRDIAPDLAASTANAMRARMTDDVTEEVRIAAIADLHHELAPKHDLYVAASDLLPTKLRTAWKEYVRLGKEKDLADRRMRA